MVDYFQLHPQYLSVYFGSTTLTQATLDCEETKWNPNDVIFYSLSANNGSDWEEVIKGVAHTFIKTGSNLLVRIVFAGNGARDTYIENLRVVYS